MKKIYLLLTLLVMNVTGFCQWESQFSGVPDANFLDIAFISEDSGWIVGSYGTIMQTVNGGAGWSREEEVTSSTLRGISFAAKDTGYIVGSSGTILRTTDRGTTWELLEKPTNSSLYSVSFISGKEGWAGCNDGMVYHTSDAGSSWEEQDPGFGIAARGICFISPMTGWACGSWGKISRTDDGGKTWTEQTSGTGATLMNIVFTDKDNGWACGSAATVLHTTDGGATWNKKVFNLTMDLYGLAVHDPATVFIAGTGGRIFRTTDDGANWSQLTTGISDQLCEVAIAGSRLYVVGAKGAVLYSEDAGETFTQVERGDEPIYSLFFHNKNRGVAVGGRGCLLLTSDGGTTWEKKIPEIPVANYTLQSVWFPDDSTGFAGGWIRNNYYSPGLGILLKTKDGGSHWMDITDSATGESTIIRDIRFTSHDTGFICGSENSTNYSYGQPMIMRTLDGGDSWETILSPVNYYNEDQNPIQGSFTLTGYAWVTGNESGWGKIYLSDDAGFTWQVRSSYTQFRNPFFTDASNGWCSVDSNICRTTDGGMSWSLVPTHQSGQISDIFFTDPLNGWAVGNQGMILASTDGGETWIQQESGISLDLYTVVFTDFQNGWVAGDGRTILHTSNGGWAVGTDDVVQDCGVRVTNYPNPFTGTTTIRYSLRTAEKVQVRIIDSFGQLVDEPVNGQQSTGDHVFSWSPGNLPAGVYIILLRTGNGVSTKKMIKL